MCETKEETLLIVGFVLHVTGGGVVWIVEFGEHCGSNVKPRKSKVRTQRITMSDHVLVFQIPSIFVCHPFCIGKDIADLAAFLRDCRFITAKLLEAYDVVWNESKWCVWIQSLNNRSSVMVYEGLQLVITGSLTLNS